MFKITCVSALVMLAASSVSAATFNTFTDRTAFEAATASVQTEDFNSFESEVSFNGQDLTIGDLTLRNDSSNQGRGLIDIPPHIFGIFSVDGTANANFVVNKNFNSVVLTFANTITAFGADFAALNNDALGVEFEVLGERITPPVQQGTTVQFFGFTSDTGFNSISLVGASETSPFDGFAGDNFTFGDAIVEATVVPLPAPAGLLLAAMAGLFFVGRRKS